MKSSIENLQSLVEALEAGVQGGGALSQENIEAGWARSNTNRGQPDVNYFYVNIDAITSMYAPPSTKCECGTTATGGGIHSSWCPAAS